MIATSAYRTAATAVITCMALILMPSLCPAAGLKVSPGSFCLQDAEIGQNLDLGIDLVISNNGNQEETYILKTVRPSEASNSWLKGYSEIPEPAWFKFAADQITIAPQSAGNVRMTLCIPAESRYHNQHWMVYVEILSKPRAGQMFTAALKPNYMIETTARADVHPYGLTAVAPSIVKLPGPVDGKKVRGSFVLFNNDTVSHRYELRSYEPHASHPQQDISISPGYERIGADGLRVKNKIEIKAGARKTVNFSAYIPADRRCKDIGWEGIVMIESDDGTNNFVRVRVTPEIL